MVYADANSLDGMSNEQLTGGPNAPAFKRHQPVRAQGYDLLLRQLSLLLLSTTYTPDISQSI